MKNIQHNPNAQSVALFMALFNFNCINNASITSANNGAAEEEGNGKLVGAVMRESLSPKKKDNIPFFLEPLSGVKLLISTMEGLKVASVVTDDNGIYCASLPSGSYWIELAPLPFGWAKDLPAIAVISEREETHLDICIDTNSTPNEQTLSIDEQCV
ncbi:MAG: carboxypeptidase regulatory-like domain-containing protein [Candidatus Jettenia sp.]|uniref:Carboxypeptidase regulatory-like domain-containing protein n=1 Tax=Candidatus Jettenia caeni TaxID=247490 RepID=I3IP24_9BACT|nr:carboxypeptidase regulatory-like domain-containing protein [Candidatus Jettenia sp. AMX1]MBC6930601.1 carboxypeptidase regulatory-like domain-containing protein [Candidatus Jettenia sp.]NUN24041.1 carboxypeptidase regulatory-like domain-containing protein [Candidatus Jettenia caeni]KAA0246742.1 MAG: carboxypeptidase regulatory-like domain-containing protein [Candidatus Jettenia sp. AMX1]MCE7882212.1 carboxypeptidase regulatory-like domain-containing protein [Candidatus Jettenia sp. AMX1]MCQ